MLVSAKTFKMKKLFKIGLAVNSLFDNFQLTAAPAREIIVKICMACTDFSEISNIFANLKKKTSKCDTGPTIGTVEQKSFKNMVP